MTSPSSSNGRGNGVGERAARVFDFLIDGGAALAAALLIAVMLTTTIKVVFRYGLEKGLIGVDQISGTMLLYIAFLELTTVQGEPNWEALVLPFAFAGVMMAGASIVAPRILLRQRSSTAGEKASSTQAGGPYLVSLILAMALAETVAIFGLVLGFLGAPPTIVLPFFVVTWILMLIRFPTQEKLNEFRT